MEQNISKPEQIMLFRYDIIHPLLKKDKQERRKSIKEIAGQSHKIPYSKKSRISKRTLRKWIRQYKLFGIRGLRPRERSDNGSVRVIKESILEKACLLKLEIPTRSVRKIIRLLELDPMLSIKEGEIKLSTLNWHLKQKGLTTKLLVTDTKGEPYSRWEASHPNELWQSDVGTGPYLPDENKKSGWRKTYFIVFTDDHSRYITGLKFYFTENLISLEDALYSAIINYGIPDQLYIDNGKIYISGQFKLICGELGIKLIYSAPGYAPGRGKVESKVKFVKQDLIPEIEHAGIKAIDELNKCTESWRNVEYNNKVHSETREKPVERWSKIKNLRTLTKEELDIIFLWRCTRTFRKTPIISISTNKYEVPAEFIDKSKNRKIELRYNPFDLTKVYLYDRQNNKLILLKPYEIKRRQDNKAVKKDSSLKKNKFEVKQSSVNYFNALHKKNKHKSQSYNIEQIDPSNLTANKTADEKKSNSNVISFADIKKKKRGKKDV